MRGSQLVSPRASPRLRLLHLQYSLALPLSSAIIRRRKMRITWELALLAGLACLGLGFAGAQNDTMFGALFAVEGGLATAEAFLSV
jgi:hypothetical protein